MRRRRVALGTVGRRKRGRSRISKGVFLVRRRVIDPPEGVRTGHRHALRHRQEARAFATVLVQQHRSGVRRTSTRDSRRTCGLFRNHVRGSTPATACSGPVPRSTTRARRGCLPTRFPLRMAGPAFMRCHIDRARSRHPLNIRYTSPPAAYLPNTSPERRRGACARSRNWPANQWPRFIPQRPARPGWRQETASR